MRYTYNKTQSFMSLIKSLISTFPVILNLKTRLKPSTYHFNDLFFAPKQFPLFSLCRQLLCDGVVKWSWKSWVCLNIFQRLWENRKTPMSNQFVISIITELVNYWTISGWYSFNFIFHDLKSSAIEIISIHSIGIGFKVQIRSQHY